MEQLILEDIKEGVYLIGTGCLMTVLVLCMIRHYLHRGKEFRHNEAAALSITIVGTLISVVLAFMLFAVWNRFEIAKSSSEQEASELLIAFRLARGFSEPKRKQVQNEIRLYAASTIDDEWAEMPQGKAGTQTEVLANKIWNHLISYQSTSDHEKMLVEQTLNHYTSASLLRSSRLVVSQTGIPKALWSVMIAGVILTIFSTCLYWVEKFVVHLFSVLLLSLMMMVVLYSIKLINNPFQGSVSVRPVGMQHVLKSFNEEIAKSPGA